ncbi:uncharacterized protein (UPF0333 family) [Polaromonas sp. CG_9.5]|nr:uncharacterized protein (UPF0333 family) [Polaromonas sp. CG_9.5]
MTRRKTREKANASGTYCRNTGQVTVEFLVALRVMVLLFFGMYISPAIQT